MHLVGSLIRNVETSLTMKVRNGLNATNAYEKIRKITYIFHVFSVTLQEVYFYCPTDSEAAKRRRL
jgi:hypothetical protein